MKTLVISFLFVHLAALAQTSNTMLGYSGLLLIPTADIRQDGEFTFGASRIPILYAKNYHGGSYERTVMFASMGFLPFIEGTFAIVRPDNMQGGVGDRSMSARLRLCREHEWRPAISIGVQDFFAIKELHLEPVSSQHFAATYVVASNSAFFSLPFFHSATFHLGYGVDWLPANDRHLHGIFAGVEFTLIPQIQVLCEYDSQSINSGVRFILFSRVHYTVALWQLRHVMQHLTFSISL